MKDKILGAIYGSVIGDVIGSPFEYHQREEIIEYLSHQTLIQKVMTSKKLELSADIKESLYVNQGILTAYVSSYESPVTRIPSITFISYLEWLYDKESKRQHWDFTTFKKIIDQNQNDGRSEDLKCLSELCSGTLATVWGSRKANGCKMKMLPMYLYFDTTDQAYLHGKNIANLSGDYSHRNIATGVLSVIIQKIIEGNSLEVSISYALLCIKHEKFGSLHRMKILDAIGRAKNKQAHHDNIHALGSGDHPAEALAIALYSCLVAGTNIEKALELSVLHDGNSACASILTGNIIGAQLGRSQLPKSWIEKIL